MGHYHKIASKVFDDVTGHADLGKADDLVVGSVPFAKLHLDDASRPRIVIDDHQNWSIWHGQHL
jgi:hypothetical protein